MMENRLRYFTYVLRGEKSQVVKLVKEMYLDSKEGVEDGKISGGCDAK